MPIYCYINPKTGSTIELVQSMLEVHEYIDNDGLKWEREFSIPRTSIDLEINPNSSQDFVDKTKNKSYSIGDMWSMSEELSNKRAKVSGRDEVKEKTISLYEKKTGKLHPSKTHGIPKNIEI